MKRISLLFIVALIAFSASGQNMEKRLAIGIGAGVYEAKRHLAGDDNNMMSDPLFTPEAYLSWCASPSFDLIITKLNLGFKPIDGKTQTDFANFGILNFRYKLANDMLFSAKSKFQPYLFAGPAYLIDNRQKQDDDFMNRLGYNFGLGFKIPVNKSRSTSLYLEGGYFDGVGTVSDGGGEEPYKDNLMKLTLGIEFAFTDNDWDNDGVKNKVDKCPKNTPEEISKGVDADGCPVDLDLDGVPDYRDDCPNTPKGCQVDARGCPLDKDKDGIIDCQDDCPDVAGPKEFKGCPDTDGDGVIDKNDECPNTPKGCKVDAKGCPLDRDKDGVIDCQDDCPDVPGVPELKGCPVICKDFQIDNVLFDFDKSDLKPAAIATLDDFVSKLGDCKDFDVLVNGHTCNIGTNNYNMTLSEKRAQSVVKYLIGKGLNMAFVTGKGYGETEPAVPNTGEANRKLNRRAVIDLIIK